MSRSTLVSIRNISISLSGHRLFEGLTLSVSRSESVAIVGANGCGKSTILNLLDSRLRGEDDLPWIADFRVSGSILLASGIDFVHLPQLIRSDRRQRLSSIGVSQAEGKAEARLCRQFGVVSGQEPDAVFSDGELQKRAIISALLEDRDLYLFDEPTNYLDIDGITAFETHVQMLKQRGRGIILVTHDRTLTDNLADQTVLITEDGIYSTTGGATDAWSVRNVDFESRSRRAKDIKKKIRRLEEDARAKAEWAAKSERRKSGAKLAKPYFAKLSAKMAKRSKISEQKANREIEKLRKAKPYVPKKVSLRFPEYEIRNRTVFSLSNVSFRYEGDSLGDVPYLLRNAILSSTTKDKICLMGSNGSGKSTTIRLAMGQLIPSKGTCYCNAGVNTVHVPQGLAGFFNRELLLDNFGDCGYDQTTIRKYLGAALIRKDKACEPVGSFSYGELMRAAIVKCILMRAEFLFLDEPTSHLDIESIAVLEQMLIGFAGGFLLVSHDRSLVGNVAEKLYTLHDGRLLLV